MIKGWGNLDTNEIDNFNAVTATNNPAAIRFAVEALNNRRSCGL